MYELRDYSSHKPFIHKPVIFHRNESVYQTLKRVLDILIAVFFVLLFLPLFILLIAAIKLDSEGSAFFVQDRVGKNGEVFKIYKFRTMNGGTQ
jgi:lipopolysaccharide/colanic/teichoic acid biosynthesis glycosyltransferase